MNELKTENLSCKRGENIVLNNINFSIKSGETLVVKGRNGSGKTTTLAKLAGKAKEKGLSSSIVAADTFRAAAVEQLLEWGKRLNIDVFTGFQNEDPSSVVFKAHKQALEKKTNVLLSELNAVFINF